MFKSATSVPEARRLPNDWHPMPSITVPLLGQPPQHSPESREPNHLLCPFSRPQHRHIVHTWVHAYCIYQCMHTTNTHSHCTHRQHEEYGVKLADSHTHRSLCSRCMHTNARTDQQACLQTLIQPLFRFFFSHSFFIRAGEGVGRLFPDLSPCLLRSQLQSDRL